MGRPTAAGQSSPTIPLDDPIYVDLDRLDAMGLLPDQVLTHRPISRREVERIISGLKSTPFPPAAREIIHRLDEAPGSSRGRQPLLEWIEVGAGKLNSEPRALLTENGVGAIHGFTQPFTSYRHGEPLADGETFWSRTSHSFPLGRALAFGLRTDARWGAGNRLPDYETDRLAGRRGRFAFESFYGRLKLGPVVIQAGRDAVAWGPVPGRGVLLSTNARPLDMILLAHESPYRLPWIFRHAGSHRATLLVSYLGGDRVLPESFLVGLRASFRPIRHLEAGFTETLIMGGEGARPATVLELLHQLFPLGSMGPDTDFADHRFGGDVRLHLWPGHLIGYCDVFIEDGRRDHWEDLLGGRAGFYAPSVGPRGRGEVRLEFGRFPAIAYRHGRWQSGYTLDGRSLGDELGPDSRGLTVDLCWTSSSGSRASLELAYEERDLDLWDQVPRPPPADPGDTGDIFRVADNPTERRSRAMLGLKWRLSRRCAIWPRFGFERISNVAAEPHHGRTDVLAEAAVRLGLGVR